MILLQFTLSFFLLLSLSECNLVIHNDCANGMLSSRHGLLAYHLTEHCTVRALVEERVDRAQDRTFFLYQEMSILSSKGTSLQGNAGLAKAAENLFDPLISFFTIAQSAQAVAASLLNNFYTGGFAPGMGSSDTVSSLQGLLHGSTLH